MAARGAIDAPIAALAPFPAFMRRAPLRFIGARADKASIERRVGWLLLFCTVAAASLLFSGEGRMGLACGRASGGNRL